MDSVIFDSEKIGQIMGWRAYDPYKTEKAVLVLQDSDKSKATNNNTGSTKRSILKLKSGKLIYYAKNICELSFDEAELLKNCLEEYQKQHKNKLEISSFFEKNIEKQNITLDSEQLQYLKKIITIISKPGNILEELLLDPELEEIAVIGTGRIKPVYVYDQIFGWLETNFFFENEKTIINVINALSAHSGKRITLQNPKLNSFLQDGSRLNSCIAPTSVSGPNITIRKFKQNPLTPVDIIESNTICAEQIAFLWMALQADCSLLICGNTGSGKTTLLNSLLNFIPKKERIVIVEETPEINPPQNHFIKLKTSEESEIKMQEIITNTLRMRPDRIIVGEIRDREEVSAFMDTLLAGQGKGSYATFHAQSAKEALFRLKNLGAMETDLTSIDLILVQRRITVNKRGNSIDTRKATELCETKIEKNTIIANQIYSYNQKKNIFENKKNSEKINEKICTSFGLTKKEFGEELIKREKFLDSLRKKKQRDFFEAINNYK